MTIETSLLASDQPTGLLIGEDFVSPNEDLEVRSPYDGSLLARLPVARASDVETAVAVAARHLPPGEPHARAEVLERAADLIGARAEAFARTICLEAAKPIAQARTEAARCRDTFIFAAAEARALAGNVVPMASSASGAGKLAFTIREPVGVVGAISPFNFPLNLVAHKLAPAIAAGCPVVLKPAEKTPLSALLLARTLGDAGLPPGALQVVFGDGATIGGALVDHPGVPLISFTGSVPVGWAIRARQPEKRVALELGNSTPVIVTEDADLDLAAARIAASGYTHAGQSCISAQRVYVQAAVADAFTARLTARVAALRLGDPLDDATDVGPVIDAAAKERVLDWLAEATGAGADVLCGGGVRDGMIEPTLLAGITPDMRVSCEEVFGPVVGIAAYDRPEEAVELANGSPFGLQAGVFTSRVDRAIALSRLLVFGAVTINETPTFRADQQPYGGVKRSGNTYEGPRYAIAEMTEERLVIIQLPTD